MARRHPLAPRGLRRLERGAALGRAAAALGAAVLGLIALASPPRAQEPPARDDGQAAVEQERRLETEARRLQAELFRSGADVEALLQALLAVHAEATGATQSALVARMVASLELGADARSGLDPEERLAHLAASERVAELLERPDDVLRAAQMRVKLLRELGRQDDAYAVGARVLDGYADLRYRAMLAVDVAFAAVDGWRLAEALERLDEAERSIPAEDPQFARTRRNLPWLRGRIYRELGLADLARVQVGIHYRMARELRADGRRSSEIATAFVNAASGLYLAQGDYDGALAMVDELLRDEELFGRYRDKRGQLHSIAGLAHLRGAGRNADPRAAVASLELALADPLSSTYRARTRLRLAEAHLLAGDAAEAADALATARAELASELEGGKEAPLEERSDLAVLESRVAFARGAGEQELTELRRLCADMLDRQVARWRSLPERAGGTGFLLYSTRRAVVGELARLEIALDPLRGPERALDHLLRVQRLGSLTRDLPSSLTTASVQRELLDPGQGLLVYLPARGTSHVFAVTRERVVHALLPTADELTAPRKAWIAHLMAYAKEVPDGDRDWIVARERELALEVAEAFLPPSIRTELRDWAEVTVVGGDELGLLPLEWLPFDGERYLGERRAVATLPSLPLGILLARTGHGRAPAHDVVLLGGAVSDVGDLPRLELGAARSAPLLRGYRDSTVLDGEAANLAALERELAGGARVLQLLVHGWADRSFERPMRLVLTPGERDDGLLTYERVRELPAAQLVLLTACGTGLAPSRMGDPGAADLCGAFLAAGADVVVTSPVELGYHEVLRLSEPLHAALAAGATTSEALRAARRALVGGDVELAPFRAGLIGVVGLGHRAVLPEGARAAGAKPTARRGWGELGLALALGAAGGAALALLLRRRQV